MPSLTDEDRATLKWLKSATAERKRMEQEGTEVTCADCRQPFIVSKGEENFLREKFGSDFAMPKRCKPCREANKERKKQQRGNGGGRRQRR